VSLALMHRYLFQRLLLTVPVLVGILFVTFALARLIPGDPCRAVLGERATDAICDEFIHRHGLDRPISVQFTVYMNEVAHGDLGNSIRFNRPVTALLVHALPPTVQLRIE